MSIPTVYKGDTVPLDFQLKWSDGTIQTLVDGTKIWVAVKGVRAPAGEAPLIVKKNAAAGGFEASAAITVAGEGKFSGYLHPVDTDLLSDGEEYVFGGVIQLPTGETYTAGVGRFTASARIPQMLS